MRSATSGPARSYNGSVVRRWGPPVSVMSAFVAALWWTWGSWPDVLVDFGRELYTAWQVHDGKVLYRDIAWLNGPLSPHVNALWFRFFGVGLRSLVIGNIALTTLLLWLLFRVFSAIGSRFSATAACLIFVGLFASGQLTDLGNFNFICPYSHDLTHGVILSFVALASFAAFLRSGSRLAIAGTGLVLGLVFLTKAEVFVAAAAALLSGLVIATWVSPITRKRGALVWLLFGGGVVLPLAVAFGLSVQGASAAVALSDTAGAWRFMNPGTLAQPFYRQMAGLTDPVGSMGAILASAAVYVAAFGAAALGSRIVRYRGAARIESLGLGLAIGVLAWGLAAGAIRWDQAARPLPLFMLGFALPFAADLLRDRADPVKDKAKLTLQLTVVVFALALLAKMLLNTVFYRYGFALAMPATLVLVVALLDWLPARLERLGVEPNFFRGFVAAGWCVLVVVHLALVASHLEQKKEVVSVGSDSFVADSRAVVVNEALADISVRLKPHQTLVVMPEGVMLNYLGRHLNPTPFLNFMPPELAAFGEDSLLAALAQHPPDYVALVHKDTTEYGVRFFGRDYGMRLQEWIEARYRVVRTFGAVPLQSDQFGISLLESIHRQ